MISLLDSAVVKFITDHFNKNYGINIPFSYDSELDVLGEFRRSVRLRVENNDYYDNMVKDIQKTVSSTKCMGLYQRSPINRGSLVSNNLPNLSTFVREYNKVSDVKLKKMHWCSVEYTLRVITDSHIQSDLIELIYAQDLDNQHKSCEVDYNPIVPGSDKEEHFEPISGAMNLFFQPMSSVGSINTSDLRTLDFSVKVEGMIFLPFSEKSSLIEKIVWELHIESPTGITENTSESGTVIVREEPFTKG